MAIAVTSQTLVDGERNLVVKCHLVSDADADVTDQDLIDASDFVGATDDLKIMGIKATLGGFAVNLHWNATSNVDIVSIPADEDVDQCFRRFGGLINNAGVGKNGDILFSTLGAGTGEEGTIILEMIKRG